MRVKRWDQALSSEDSNEILCRLALWHLHQAPRDVYDLTSMIMERRYKDICSLTIVPTDCESANEFYHWSQVTAFFKKRGDLRLGVDPKAAAIQTFWEAESLCKQTNELFKLRARGEFSFSSRVEAVLHHSRRQIARILGSVPGLQDLRPRFGPGATTQVRKDRASARAKLSQTAACSEDMVGAASAVLRMFPSLSVLQSAGPLPFEIHEGRVNFVPKSWKTHRGIAVEPWLNGFVQLGIGDYLAHLLRRSGTDISDQTRNQNLARIGSADGSLATIDLSSASDTVAEGLVYELLPIDWFAFLRTYRTSKVTVEGRSVKLQKFSTMGNGFTFPLETLIFKVLAEQCTPDDRVSVYGDDIILPAQDAPLLIEVLSACGFKVNEAKSFTDGPFRESCGKDYFWGIDVRPCFIKDRLLGADLFRLHNFYFRRGEREASALVLRYIDERCRVFGPDGYGDGHLLMDDFVGEPLKCQDGWSGTVFRSWSWEPRADYSEFPNDYAYSLYTIYRSPPSKGLPGWAYGAPCHYGTDRQPHRYSEHGYMGVGVPGRKRARLNVIYRLG